MKVTTTRTVSESTESGLKDCARCGERAAWTYQTDQFTEHVLVETISHFECLNCDHKFNETVKR